MIWTFDGFGQWDANSKKKNGADEPKSWVIDVCEDGTFMLENSCSGLMSSDQSRKTFPTLAKAKKYCEELEASNGNQA